MRSRLKALMSTIVFWYEKKRHRVLREGDVISIDGGHAKIAKHTRTQLKIERIPHEAE